MFQIIFQMVQVLVPACSALGLCYLGTNAMFAHKADS